MAKVIAKYQVKVPPVLMEGAEVIELEPIKLETDIGKVIIYPPGSKERKPKSYTKPQKGFYRVEVKVEGKDSQLWNADTLWVDIEAEVTSILSEKKIRDRLDTKTHEVVYQFLKLLRRKLPEAPLFLPISLRPSVDYDLSQVLKEKGHIFRAAATPFTFKIVSTGAGLTKDKWTELQQEMSSGEYTELYEDFIADSKAALDEDDLNRATLYAAIGCEIFIKEYSEKSAKEKGISPIFWEYLKDPNTETRVRTYYDQVLHLVKGHSMKKENKETYNRLDRIFQARNKIMHEGKIPSSWNRDKINQLREDIREVEKIISWVLEL